MRLLFLLGFFLIQLSQSHAQKSILLQENWIGSYKYYSQGVALTKPDVAIILKDYSKLKEEFIKGNKRLKTGMWFMISGGVITLSGLMLIYSFPDLIPKGLFVPMAISIGLPFFLIGKQFQIGGKNKINFAISTFNDSQLDLKRKKIELNIGLTSNGLGLILNF